MSSGPTTSVNGEVSVPIRSALWMRLADYADLTRPRIALMAMLTVTVGYSLGSAGHWNGEPLLHAVLGIALVAASSSALNQVIERVTDSLMPRTSDRPLPAGRMTVFEASVFGLGCGIGGCVYLLLFVNSLTAVLSLFTLLTYVALYTPMKRYSSLCVVVGAVAGAMPPVLGWTAAGGPLDSRALSLFAILFLWQFPHFMAIAWLYRRDYEQAGLRMAPVAFGRTRTMGLIAVVYSLVLIPVGLLPSGLASAENLAGDVYTLAALILSIAYAMASVRFALRETIKSARELLLVSLLYLPGLLIVLTYDHFRLLQ